VPVDANGGTVLNDVGALISRDGSGGLVVGDAVDDKDGVGIGEVDDEIEARSPEILNPDAFGEVIARSEETGDVRTYSVVAQQNVPYSGDKNSLHSTFTLAMLLPEGSKVWQAQAMQGS